VRTGVDPRNGLEELSTDNRLHHVRASTIGRLVVVVDGQPLVLPVNFTLDGSVVVQRTDPATNLYATQNGVVAFDCDGIDPITLVGV